MCERKEAAEEIDAEPSKSRAAGTLIIRSQGMNFP